MNRSVLLAVAVCFGIIAMQVGPVQAKNIKGQTPAKTVNPLKTAKHQGGTLVSEEGPFGPASPTKSPVWSRINPITYKQLLPPFKVTFGGNPPRAPQSGEHNGCDHNGCDHNGCDHYGCDRHHDCRHSWDWMSSGDMCYGDCHRNTCSDFDFCW
jgi:hypothetical protein